MRPAPPRTRAYHRNDLRAATSTTTTLTTIAIAPKAQSDQERSHNHSQASDPPPKPKLSHEAQIGHANSSAPPRRTTSRRTAFSQLSSLHAAVQSTQAATPVEQGTRAAALQACTRPPKTPGAELPPVWTTTTPWRPRSMASLPCPIPLHSTCPRRSHRCLFHPRALADGRDAPPHADPARSVPGPPLHSLAAPPRASVAAGRAPAEEERPAPRRPERKEETAPPPPSRTGFARRRRPAAARGGVVGGCGAADG